MGKHKHLPPLVVLHTRGLKIKMERTEEEIERENYTANADKANPDIDELSCPKYGETELIGIREDNSESDYICNSSGRFANYKVGG